MIRWRFNLYTRGSSDPFHSDLHYSEGVSTDQVGLPLVVAVAVRVAFDDERVDRIEFVRQTEVPLKLRGEQDL